MLSSYSSILYLHDRGYSGSLPTWLPSLSGASLHDDALEDRRHPTATPSLIYDITVRYTLQLVTLALTLVLGIALAVGPVTRRALSRTPVSNSTCRNSDHSASSHRVDARGLKSAVRVLSRGSFSALRRMYDSMMSLAGMFGSMGRNNQDRVQRQQQEALLTKNREKLQGFHDIAREAIDRAYNVDLEGRYDAAVRLYNTALEAAKEGLALQVAPSNGLGPKADNVATWRIELEDWKHRLEGRLKAIQSGNLSSPSAPPVRPVPFAAAAAAASKRPHGAAAAAAPSPQPTGRAASGRPAFGAPTAPRPSSAGRIQTRIAAAAAGGSGTKS
ncbi:hypothetical protein VOLCADRAFT_92915, partial [Volvox carteri f. nagariensis]